jgi:hypothetical protein
MSAAIQMVHVLAGLVVLAEALNKLERCAPFARNLTGRERIVDGLKALAWFLLALGAAGALAAPALRAMGLPVDAGGEFSRLERPTLAETLVLTGFAVLIIRTRVKEG